MENYIVRGFKDSDLRQIEEMWVPPTSWAGFEGRRLLQESRDEPFRYAVSAVKDGAVVAAAVVAQSALHPSHAWTYIEVEQSRRRQGIGRGLLQDMERQLRSRRKKGTAHDFEGLQSKISSAEAGGDAAQAFAVASGFTMVQTIETFRISPGASSASVPADGMEIAVEGLATGSVELTQAVGDFYRGTHNWNKTADVSLGRTQQLFLGAQSGAHGALVVRDSNRSIMAFAVSYGNNTGTTRVIVGYDLSFARNNKSGIERVLHSLIALLTYRDPIEVEVPQGAVELRGVLDSLVRSGGDKVAVTMCDKIFLKRLVS